MKFKTLQNLEPGTLLVTITDNFLVPVYTSVIAFEFITNKGKSIKVGETVMFLKPEQISHALVLYGKQKYFISAENLEIAKEK